MATIEFKNDKYILPCGCCIDINYKAVEKRSFPLSYYEKNQILPPINWNVMNMIECPEVWKLLGQGLTKGVFQLESNLGRNWCKKLKPENMEHLSALGSILRPGCVGGDSSISMKFRNSTKKSNKFKQIKIRDLYNLFSKSNHKSNYRKHIISCYENNLEFFQNNIENIIFSGNKEVFLVKIKNTHKLNFSDFYNLECTLDHKLLTKHRGWVELKDLKIGELIAVRNCLQSRNFTDEKLSDRKFRFNENCFYNYEYKCIFCNWLEAPLDVNHLYENRSKNNHADNLCYMCPNHHRMFTFNKISVEECLIVREKFKLNNTKDVQWGYFNGIESKGIKDTYDITTTGPNHNFIAGNVVVHNCLWSLDSEGISLTEHFCRRKNGLEEVSYVHPLLEQSLGTTYGILCYQEQSMQIVKDVAGFDLQQADKLRKAIGKKLPEEMRKVELMFIEKAENAKLISKHEAEIIFSWIKQSQRYSFNKSHSMSYAINGYLTAYGKSHFPVEFFTSWLYYARFKQKPKIEIASLVSEAKLMNIEVVTPDITKMKEHFYTDGSKIYFGISDIKGIGASKYERLQKAIAVAETRFGKKVDEMNWYEFLILVGSEASGLDPIVSVGATRNVKD